MISVGVIGLGAISQVHIDAIEHIEDAQIIAVCDNNLEKKNKYPYPFYSDVREMIKNEKLDCIHICLPHNLHVPIAKLALENNISVFLEKPVGLSVKELETLSYLETISNAKVAVCLQNRYNKTNVQALELIKNQTYGRLKGCKAILTWDRRENYYDKDPWRGKLAEAGGGAMLSQAIHMLDLIGVFCGPIKSVKGFFGNLLLENIEVEDTACGSIKHENGTNSIFYCTVTHCYDSAVEFELIFEKGILQIKDNCLTEINKGKSRLLEKDLMNIHKSYYGAGHQETISRFYQSLRNNTNDYVKIKDVRQVSELIECVIESSKENQRVELKA